MLKAAQAAEATPASDTGEELATTEPSVTDDDCERLAFSPEELQEAMQREVRMQQLDAEIKSLIDARNDLESFIFEMRGLQ